MLHHYFTQCVCTGHTVDFTIFEKSQLAVNLSVDDLNDLTATEIGFSLQCMCIRDEKPISVAFYSFRSSTGRFTGKLRFFKNCEIN